jgi:hypothetical protein
MEAYQVELDESMTRRLEAGLTADDRKVEVINFGVGAYGTTQEFLTLKEEGLKYGPDLVILAVSTNDIRNNSFKLEWKLREQKDIRNVGRPFLESAEAPVMSITTPNYEWSLRFTRLKRQQEDGKSWHRKMITYELQKRFFLRLRRYIKGAAVDVSCDNMALVFGWPILETFNPKGTILTSGEYEELWSEAWALTKRLILEIRNLSRDNGAAFMLLVVPGTMQADSHHQARVEALCPGNKIDPVKFGRVLSEFGAENDLNVLDLTPVFIENEAGRGPLFHKHEDKHWNAAGHRLAAETLTQYLIDNDLIPR